MHEAVAAAKRAFGDWAATDTEQRAHTLARAAELIEEHAKEKEEELVAAH